VSLVAPARAVNDSGRVLRASALLSCAYYGSIGIFNPFAPLWYQSLGLPLVTIGLLVSLLSWTRLFAPFLWGAVADRSGQRVGLIRMAALACWVSALGLLLPLSAAGLMLAVFLMYFFNAAVTPLNEALIAAELQATGGVDPKRYGRVRLWGSAGFLVTVSACGWWFDWLGMQAFPYTVVGGLALLVLAAWRLPRRAPSHAAHDPAPPLAPTLRRPEVRWFFAAMFFTVLAHAALYAFYSLYLTELGYSKGEVGALWAISVVVEIAWFALQGRWLHQRHLHHWLILAGLVTALRFAGTAALGASLAAMLALQCLHAITFAAQHTACVGLLARYFPGRLQGRGQALYVVLGYCISGVLGSLAGAWLAQGQGYSACFWAAAVCGLIGAVCQWRCARRDPLH
jgi:PPP family 3-phenylpropionic acid transporter